MNAWIDAAPGNRWYVENLVTREAMNEDLRILMGMDEASLDRMVWDRIHAAGRATAAIVAEVPVAHPGSAVPPVASVPTGKLYPFSPGMIAASIVILVIFSFLHASKSNTLALAVGGGFSPYRASIFERQYAFVTQPVTRPMLTVSQDSIYFLDDLPEGRLLRLGNFLVIKRGDRSIVYLHTEHDRAITGLQDSMYNMVSVPSGDDDWTIHLPDGSIVNLAPGSSLAYAVHPAGGKPARRMAMLYGHAKFEIAHDPASLFFLETANSELKIPGTRFMVEDFGEKDAFSVVQYSDSLDLTVGQQHIELEAAQRATIGPDHTGIEIHNDISIPKQLPTKPQTFDFSHRNLKSALRELACWYGIKRVYVDRRLDTITPGALSLGHLSKDLSLHELFTELQKQTDNMQFTADEDMISVTR